MDKEKKKRPRSGEQTHHSPSEVGNNIAAQKLVRSWAKGDDKNLPTSLAISRIYAQVMDGFHGITKDSTFIPYRGGHNTEVRIKDKSPNFLAEALTVPFAMRDYIDDLDLVLAKESHVVAPETILAETVHDAAWAYYTFGRIHPYMDGNGRMGRNILKRVLSGRGFNDFIIQSNDAYGVGRNAHLDALEAVDKSGNLVHLEKYILEQMRGSYPEGGEVDTKIESLIGEKKEEIKTQRKQADMSSVWPLFSQYGIQIDRRTETSS